MCNCNSKRTSYLTHPAPNKRGMVKIILIENPPRVLNGEITGRTYIFSKLQEILWVDKRDSYQMQAVPGLQILT